MEPDNQNKISAINNTGSVSDIPAPPQTSSSSSVHDNIYRGTNGGNGNKKVTIGIIVLVIIIALGVAVFLLNQNHSSSATNDEQVTAYTLDEIQKPLSVTAEEYNSIKPLSLSVDQIPEGAVVAGPAYVSLKNYKISLISSPVPNVNNSRSSSLVMIDNVTDRNGNVYAGDEPDEDFFTDINWDFIDTEPIGLRMFGSRNWYHPKDKDLKDQDIANITGRLVFNLPIDITEMTFDTSEIGVTKTVNGVSITLDEIGERNADAFFYDEESQVNPNSEKETFVKYTYSGKVSLYSDLIAYSSADNTKSLKNESIRVRSTSDGDTETTLTETFSEPVGKIIFYIAKDIYHVEYPFSINNPEPKQISGADIENGEQGSISEKELIIEGMLRTLNVFKSKDIEKIRTYIKKTSSIQTDADNEMFEKMTDKEIIDFASLIVDVSISEEKLRSPDAIWQIGETEATVEISDGEGGTSSQTAQKIDGVWY